MSGVEPASSPYKEPALPLSYTALNLAPGAGLEPATSWLTARRYHPLSYPGSNLVGPERIERSKVLMNSQVLGQRERQTHGAAGGC